MIEPLNVTAELWHVDLSSDRYCGHLQVCTGLETGLEGKEIGRSCCVGMEVHGIDGAGVGSLCPRKVVMGLLGEAPLGGRWKPGQSLLW